MNLLKNSIYFIKNNRGLTAASVATFLKNASTGWVCVLGVAALALSGCGQKGALYLPAAPTPTVDVSAEIEADAAGDSVQNY